MFKKNLFLLALVFLTFNVEADDCSISKFISDYLTRINTYILDDDYVKEKYNGKKNNRLEDIINDEEDFKDVISEEEIIPIIKN